MTNLEITLAVWTPSSFKTVSAPIAGPRRSAFSTTLLRRVRYGGRKGRSAARRLAKWLFNTVTRSREFFHEDHSNQHSAG